MRHDMDKGLEDGRSSCKVCGQVEGYLSQKCPGAPIFKITEAGTYRRRDGAIAYMVDITHIAGGSVEVWRDANTGNVYYPDGFCTANPGIHSALDIVERVIEPVNAAPPGVHEISKMSLFNQSTAYEHVPDRLTIASRILASLLSSNKYEPHFYQVAVTCAVELTDKLIARVQETKK